jgi:hypothetical protein
MFIYLAIVLVTLLVTLKGRFNMPREPNHSKNWGGKRVGSGRQVGSTSKYQKIYEQKANESGEHPIDYLLSIMRDTGNEQKVRMHAAHAVLPYVAARLNAIDINVHNPLETMTLAEKLAQATALRNNIAEQQPDFLLPELPGMNDSPFIEGEAVKMNGSKQQ